MLHLLRVALHDGFWWNASVSRTPTDDCLGLGTVFRNHVLLLCAGKHRGGADVILAGDVLYKADLPPLLFATMRGMMERHGGTSCAVLCHIPRAGITQEIVVEQAKRAGLAIANVPFKVLRWKGVQHDTKNCGLPRECDVVVCVCLCACSDGRRGACSEQRRVHGRGVRLRPNIQT